VHDCDDSVESTGVVNRVIVLYVDGYFVNQWDATCLVALEEKGLAYTTARGLLRGEGGVPAALAEKTGISRVPVLQHADTWLTESLAIVEYLEEQFPAPAHPSVFPTDPIARAKARQWMSFVRTDLAALRDEVSWWRTVYHEPPPTTLSPACRRDANDLLALVRWLVANRELGAWNIAHADLALTLLRVRSAGIALGDDVAQFLDTTLARPSVRKYLEHQRPPHRPPVADARG
jgi:glutathione S-transferase